MASASLRWRLGEESAQVIPTEQSCFSDFRSELVKLCQENGVDVLRPPVNMLARPSSILTPRRGSQSVERTKRRVQRRLQKVQVHTYLSPVKESGRLDDVWSDRAAAARGWAAEAVARVDPEDEVDGREGESGANGPDILQDASLFITAHSAGDSAADHGAAASCHGHSACSSHCKAMSSEANVLSAYTQSLRASPARASRPASRSASTTNGQPARAPPVHHRHSASTPSDAERRKADRVAAWVPVIAERELAATRRKAATSRSVYQRASTPTSSSTRRRTIDDVAPPPTTLAEPSSEEKQYRRDRESVRLRSRLSYQAPVATVTAMPFGVCGEPMVASPYMRHTAAFYRDSIATRDPNGREHRCERRATDGRCRGGVTASSSFAEPTCQHQTPTRARTPTLVRPTSCRNAGAGASTSRSPQMAPTFKVHPSAIPKPRSPAVQPLLF